MCIEGHQQLVRLLFDYVVPLLDGLAGYFRVLKYVQQKKIFISSEYPWESKNIEISLKNLSDFLE